MINEKPCRGWITKVRRVSLKSRSLFLHAERNSFMKILLTIIRDWLSLLCASTELNGNKLIVLVLEF
jgi:hypothetical protein